MRFQNKHLNRRDFLKRTASIGLGICAAPAFARHGICRFQGASRSLSKESAWIRSIHTPTAAAASAASGSTSSSR